MDLSLLIPMILTFLAFFIFAVEVETRLLKLSDFLNNKAWDWIFSLPSLLYNATLGRLFGWIGESLSGTSIGALDRRLAQKGIGGLRPLLWAIASLVFVTVWLIRVPAALEELVLNYLTGTAIGAPFAFLMDGISLSLPVIIGAGFTRFLSTEAMRQQNDNPAAKTAPLPEMHTVAKWVYGLIFTGAFSLLGTAMSGVFETISTTIVTLADKISAMQIFTSSAGFWDWFYLIVSIVGVVVVGYLWILLLFMTIKEYISNISYCLLPLSLLLLTVGLLSIFGTETVNWIAGILFLAAMIFGEWHRYQMEHDPVRRRNYLQFMDRFRIFTNYIWPWLKRRFTRSLCPCSPCSIFRFFR